MRVKGKNENKTLDTLKHFPLSRENVTLNNLDAISTIENRWPKGKAIKIKHVLFCIVFDLY